MSKTRQELRVLQIINHYEAPFLDCTRQYAVLFKDIPARVVTVFLRGAPSDEVQQVLTGTDVIFLGLDKSQVRGLKLKAIREIRKLHQKQSFDLCIAHRYHPTKIATQVGKFPIISVNHTFGLYTRWERRLYIRRKQARLTLLNVSNAVRDQTRSVFPSISPDKIRTFYNHVDIEKCTNNLLNRQQARRHLNLPEDAFVIANVGRLHKDKDQKTLLDGFAKALPSLPDNALLVIYGKGPLETTLKGQAQQLGIDKKVIFGGFINNLSSCFKAFDIFALTSDHEPCAMALLESMVAGVPIIGSDCGGTPELIGGVGMLFPLGNSNDLSACMIEIAQKKPQEIELISAAHLKRVRQNFSDESAILAFKPELTRIHLEYTF